MGNTYECERIFKKSTNRFLRCVFCRPCVVPEPIYSHFVGFIGTGLISLSSLTFVGLDKSLTYAAKPTIIFPSLGHLCGYLFKKRDRGGGRGEVFVCYCGKYIDNNLMNKVCYVAPSIIIIIIFLRNFQLKSDFFTLPQT